jgi:hypothetical protein
MPAQLIFDPEDGSDMFLRISVHIHTTRLSITEDGNKTIMLLQNYWVIGLCSLYSILKIREHNVLEA